MADFPEIGKRYTVDNFPSPIPSGYYKIMLNNVETDIFSTDGITYIPMEKAAALTRRSPLGYRNAIIKKEIEEKQKLRFRFGGREVWMELSDVKRLFFTRQPVEEEEIEQAQPVEEEIEQGE